MITDNINPKYANSLRPIIQGFDYELIYPIYYKGTTVLTTNTATTKAGKSTRYYRNGVSYDQFITFGNTTWSLGGNILIDGVLVSYAGDDYNYIMVDYNDEVTSTLTSSSSIKIKALDEDEVELGLIGTITWAGGITIKRKPTNFISTVTDVYALVDGTYTGDMRIILIENDFSITLSSSKPFAGSHSSIIQAYTAYAIPGLIMR